MILNLERRRLGLALLAAGAWPALAAWPVAAFSAHKPGEVFKALGAPSEAASESADVTLTADDIAENGAAVPVEFGTRLPGVRRVALLIEKNPGLLSAVFDPGPGVEPRFGLRVKLAESSALLAAVLLADGRTLLARRDVKVILGGCAGDGTDIEPAPLAPTLIRAVASPLGANVRLRLSHPMESGQRRDGAGQLVPAWHIQDVDVALNGRSVLTAAFGPSVAQDPLLQFTLVGARAGDRLGVGWADNRGQRRHDDGAVA